ALLAAVVAAGAATAAYRVRQDPGAARVTPVLMPTRDGPFGIRLVQIPAATIYVGSPPGEDGRGLTEGRHAARVAAFYVATTEVTRGVYRRVMADGRPPPPAADDALPATGVTWDEAQEFCRRLSAADGGLTFRLPTEEEWEWAARAGDDGPFSGTRDLRSMGWFSGNAAGPRPVAGKSPNWWGIHDMHGNAREWTATLQEGSDRMPGELQLRVVRGGGFRSPERACRAAAREFEVPSTIADDLGFRVAADVPPQR
ncbi:MAG TPA: formylglycine-generating enzyme family protein, partial [Humisphaera sp.]